MRAHLTVLLIASALVAACEETPPPAAPPPAPAAPPPTVQAAPPPPPVDSNPTVLAEGDRARDQALAPRATAIVDAYPNLGSQTALVAQLSRDKKRVLYASQRDGVPEIFVGEVAKPAEAPRAITHGPERASFASFTRDEKHILFLRDDGADENWRIWRTDPDGSNATLLTPGPKEHRDEPLLPRKKPDMMVYTTHVNASPSSWLVVQSISGGEPKRVYEDPAPAFITDVTADGARALVIRWNSASDIVVLEVATAGEKPAVRVYPPEGTKANVNAASYAADEKRVLVATDEGKEGFALLALDAKDHAAKARWAVDEPRSAAIGAVSVSPKGDRLAVSLDAGDHTELRILDAGKLSLQRKVDLPLGSGGVGAFTEDGKAFALSLSTPDHPADIFLVDAATGAQKPLRDDKRSGLDALPPLTVSLERLKAHDGLTIPVNLYRPAAPAGAQRMPTLALFHGGPASSSQVAWRSFVRFFTSLGWAVAEPNIRGSTGFGRAYEMADDREKRGDALKDVETVNAWVKAQPWADPNRVVVFGGSYGGYLTLMALTRQPALWRAGVDLCGIANLETFLASTDQAIRLAFIQEFGDLEKDAALLAQYTPSRDYDKIVAPLFVYAGQNDPRVPRSESDQIVMALRRRRVPVEYMVAANEGHSLDRRENQIEFMTRVARFLEDRAK